MSRTRLAAIALLSLAPLIGAGGVCALGEEEEPGCRDDALCGEGYVCRGGACFRITTGLSTPDPGEEEAGSASDAAAPEPDSS
jgi:hypothetical protein